MERGEPVVCFDTDRENASLRDVPALKAEPVSLFLPNSDEIDVNAMDAMTERLLGDDAHFVLDNGATSFAPLSRYFVQDGISDAVAESGKKMVVHVIVAGGQELVQTGRGFDSVASQFPASADMVLWLNEHHGQVDGADGASFEQTPIYQKHRGRIQAIVRLSRQHPGTFGANLADMLQRGLTFAEADQSSEFLRHRQAAAPAGLAADPGSTRAGPMMEADQLIAEIARTIGLRLDKSDPILAAAVINEVLLDRALVKLDRQVKIQADRVTAASTQAVVDAKREAELLLTEAGEWIEEKIKVAVEAAGALLLNELKRELQQAQKTRRACLRAAWFTLVVCLIVLSSLAGAYLASFR